MSANAHNLILRWAAARKERDAAKKRRAETLCKEHGRLLSEAGLDSDKIVLAYEERDTPASREAHNHYRTAAAKQGAAMRAMTAYAEKEREGHE